MQPKKQIAYPNFSLMKLWPWRRPSTIWRKKKGTVTTFSQNSLISIKSQSKLVKLPHVIRKLLKKSIDFTIKLMKKWNKEHQTFSFQFFTNRSSILMFFVLFFHGVCKISNINVWTSKLLAQGSCTELISFTSKCSM